MFFFWFVVCLLYLYLVMLPDPDIRSLPSPFSPPSPESVTLKDDCDDLPFSLGSPRSSLDWTAFPPLATSQEYVEFMQPLGPPQSRVISCARADLSPPKKRFKRK
jgi:hypothetical protein